MVTPGQVTRAYYLISFTYTVSAALIWGVNTLFLLDAGLDIFGVFVANSAFTAAMVLFELPTGVLADTRGRRVSFLASVAVLGASTLGYVGVAQMGGGLVLFFLVSVVMGLGFTLFSGAVEAWMVDALTATGYVGSLDQIFAKGAIVTGSAMLAGTVGGGLLGTLDLAFPFLVRSALLVVSFVFGFVLMHDLGFTPRTVTLRRLGAEMRSVGKAGVQWGWREPQLRRLVSASFLHYGFLTWAWYAWQPYFLDMLGDGTVWVAGVIAAANALAMICGNSLVEFFSRFCGKRTTLLLWASAVHAGAAVVVGLVPTFWVAFPVFLVLMASTGVLTPVKQAYLHQVVPSEHRATVVSFDSMVGNAGGIGGQIGLGALSRSVGIASGYVVGGAATVLALPIFWALRRMGRPADRIVGTAGKKGACAAQGLPEVATVDPKARVPETAGAG